MNKLSTFDELLNVFWLRPETALWRELDIRAMQGYEFKSPSLDIGCGDGIFSFIRAGGKFKQEFDAFQTLGNLDQFFDNADVFDAYDDRVMPLLEKAPDYLIDCAFDHKENLLKKASKLQLYKNTQQGDGNRALPYESNSFNSIFSNILYWLDRPEKVLKEIGRVLQPKGQVCLMLPNTTLPEFSFYNQLCLKPGDRRWAFLEQLDRGRFSDNIRQAKSREEWEELFESAGLSVLSHKAHLSKTVIQAWDIGLRPLFPVLLKMAKAIPNSNLLEIKEEWVETLRHFLLPLADMDNELAEGLEPAFHCFILEKSDV